MLFLRSMLFATSYCVVTALMGLAAFLILQWLPYERAASYVVLWNRWTTVAARICCGLHWNVIGEENLPDKPAVFISNHESQGETYFLQYSLFPVSIVLKKELLKIPFFGIGLKLTNPIAIDRNSRKQAMQTLLTEGKKRLESGRHVLIFPQGTRQAYPAALRYARGGAAIAIEAGVDIVPIAHNASKYWPTNGFGLKPGTIDIVIGEPISSAGKSPKQLTEEVRLWTEQQLELIYNTTQV